jgi:hypothetical protein
MLAPPLHRRRSTIRSGGTPPVLERLDPVEVAVEGEDPRRDGAVWAYRRRTDR